LWSPRRHGRGATLASQFLVLQLTVLLLVLAAASVVSIRQSELDFRDQRGARLRAAGENLANTALVRERIDDPAPQRSLSFYSQRTQSLSGASAVYLTDATGTILVAPDPTALGETIDLGDSDVQQLRTWTGDVDDRGDRSIAAHVPLIDDSGELVGIVMVAETYPGLAARLAQALPDLVVFLGAGLALGVAGSWFLARLIKRRTRGLEPAEIAALADQREALLHSVREGVFAVNTDGVLTVVNDSARELLDLPAAAPGQRLHDLDLGDAVRDQLSGDTDIRDAVIVVAGRVVVLNRNRVLHEGRQVGTVTTLRDRTELVSMQSELNARETITETLRAQTHEFANQLHTISGLVQLEEYDEVTRLVGNLTRRRAEISDFVTARVDDRAVAALLVAKASLATERGVRLELSDASRLPRLDRDLSVDVATVLGNLVDNAVDATAASDGSLVAVWLSDDGEAITVEVADSGSGVPDEERTEIFRRGYSTKPSDEAGRGVGLALVRLVCDRRGGWVDVHNEPGAVFTARLPYTKVVS
jgi:sensor histidine kinase regulating citrate/malate metabolism